MFKMSENVVKHSEFVYITEQHYKNVIYDYQVRQPAHNVTTFYPVPQLLA